MTLEQLRIFVAAAECEHVTQGARQRNLTQSATSAAVAGALARPTPHKKSRGQTRSGATPHHCRQQRAVAVDRYCFK
jgi:hypothetical protein